MNKNKFAITPPMGWNSYDYYDTTVNEEQVKKNAQYMAMHRKCCCSFELPGKSIWKPESIAGFSQHRCLIINR